MYSVKAAESDLAEELKDRGSWSTAAWTAGLGRRQLCSFYLSGGSPYWQTL